MLFCQQFLIEMAIQFVYRLRHQPNSHSQLISNVHSLVQRLHRHNLHHQARPASEMLRALTSTRLRVVLLPREARLLPALVDRINQICAQLVIQNPGLALERTLLGANFL
jgi:hypothetical protein